VFQACDLKHAESCGRAAFLAETDGLSDAEVLALFQRGCELGHVESCHFVVPRSKGADAVNALTTACGLGAGESCQALGVMALKGVGVPLDTAGSWLRQACELGEAKACLTVGAMYLEGRGVPKDAALADSWLAKGCLLGETAACR